MGSGRRDRRKDRAREFGAKFGSRHPRLAIGISCIPIAGLILVGAAQLNYYSYLGRGWLFAAFAGMAAAAGFSAAVLVGIRRNSPSAFGVLMAWLALWVLSVTAIRFPLPPGSHSRVQAFFNGLHAALLGYEAVACTAMVTGLAYLVLHPRGFSRSRTAQAGHAPDRGELPARLRFPSAMSATWRAGRLIAANGTVTWHSLNGDSEMDLTSACQSLPVSPTDTRQRQPRTTTLATGDGLVEVDVSPIALETLARRLHRPPIR